MTFHPVSFRTSLRFGISGALDWDVRNRRAEGRCVSKRRPVISLRYVLSPVSGRLPSALSILYFDTRILATPIVVCRRLYVCNAQSRVPLSVPPLEAYIREALHHYYPILL